MVYATVMAEKDIVYFQLRLPRDLYDRMATLKERDEDRSLHWEALRIFRAGLAVIEAEQPAS